MAKFWHSQPAQPEADPALVNRDPYGDGWMVKLRLANPSDLKSLLSPSAYRSHIGE
jgi:glycine cleavage system H protein